MQNEFDYKRYLQLIEKKKKLFIIVALAIMTCAILLSYIMPKKFEANCTVFIEKNVISELVKGIAVTPSLEDTIKVLTYAISSRTLITKVINELDPNIRGMGDAKLESTIARLQKETNIKLKDKEGLFTISFLDENPRFARDYVNTLVRRYIEDSLSTKREESYGATKFLSDQIKTFKEELDQSEDKLNKFKSEKGVAIAVNEGEIQKDISASQQRLDDLSVRRSQLETLRNQLKKSDPAKTRIHELQKRLEELRVEYTDNYPEVMKVKSDIEALRQEMKRKSGGSYPGASENQELEKVEAELRAVRNSEENQRTQLAASRSLLSEGPMAKAQLEKLEQDRVNRKNIYEQLYARHGQAEVSKQMEVQDKSTTFRIVDAAVTPIKPVSPNRVRIILMGVLAGIAGGMALLLLLDKMDHSVKSLETIKSLGFPVLASIPSMKTADELADKRKKDLRLYRISAGYFSIILIILTLEATGLTCMDSVSDYVRSIPYMDNVRDWFR